MSATMMDYSRRQILTLGPSGNKRKERDGLDGLKPSAITTKNLAKPSIHRAPPPVNKASAASPKKQQQAASNNQLLAEYLAHEFLTNGTLFGEPWDPAGAGSGAGAEAEALLVSSSSASNRNEKRKAEPPRGRDEKREEKRQRYLEVADLLKGDGGAHLPGIVNPTQLARFLQLG